MFRIIPDTLTEKEATMNFLYISDVFCPWCYGFGKVMRRITADNPEIPVRTLCGLLMEEPMTTAEMVEEMPNVREFFDRLASTTGQEVGEAFLRQLGPEGDLRMDSGATSLPLRALKELAPGRALEQMEAFQQAFYGQGRDILALETQIELAARFGVGADDFRRALADAGVRAGALEEDKEAREIMGEFTLYPTLYLEKEDGGRVLLARGYIPLKSVETALSEAIGDKTPILAQVPGAACFLNGNCG